MQTCRGTKSLSNGAIYTVCNVLHGWSRGQKNEQQNNVPNPKKQCSCRLQGSSENRTFERCRSTESNCNFEIIVVRVGTNKKR